VEGAANRALIRFLSKALGISRSRIRLVAGKKSRNKRIELVDVRASEVEERLKAMINPAGPGVEP
jgi:uncharacterized protein YggU (UPF0235/DUF167 family)